MNILGFEPTQEQIEFCLAAMTGRFTAAAIVAVAIEHGVPGGGAARAAGVEPKQPPKRRNRA